VFFGIQDDGKSPEKFNEFCTEVFFLISSQKATVPETYTDWDFKIFLIPTPVSKRTELLPPIAPTGLI
jgi:hypothetical protein